MLLNVSNLERALSALTSVEHIKEAERVLLAWQTEDPNQCCSYLICTTLNPSLQVPSLLVLKQVILQYWKERGRAATKNGGIILQDSLKEQVRATVLAIVLGAPEHPLQQDESIPIDYRGQYQIPSPEQRSAAISVLTQIARYDLPKTNTSLLPSLFSHLPHSLPALEAVLEIISEKRLLGTKQYLASLAMEYLSPALQIVANEADHKTSRSMINCIRHMLSTSFGLVVQKDPSSVDMLLSTILEWPLTRGDLKDVLWDMVVGFLKQHPNEFGQRYLVSYLDFFWKALQPLLPQQAVGAFQVGSAETALYTWEHLVSNRNLQSGLSGRCLISVLEFFSQATSKFCEKEDPSYTVVWNQFYSMQRLLHLSDLCCFSLMISCGDNETLTEWTVNAEEYFWQMENEIEGESVGTAAQSLYCALIESEQGKEVIAPRLVEVLNHSEGQGRAWRDEAEGKLTTRRLMWDSIFTAAGLSSTLLEDSMSFDFNEWYSRTTKNFVQSILLSDKASPPLLARRIVWMAGCFSSVLSKETRIYEDFLRILTNHQDLMLCLTALQTLSSILLSFSDGALSSIELSRASIEGFYGLADRCGEIDSQNLALDAVGLVLAFTAGMGENLAKESANAAVAPLPVLWDSSTGDRSMLRKHALSICTLVASGVGVEEVPLLHPIVIPIVDSCLDPRHCNDHSHLVRDALALWLTVLRLESHYNAELLGLFERAKCLIDVDFEHLRSIAFVTEMLILQGGEDFLERQSQTLGELLKLSVGKVSPRGASFVHLVMETLLRENPTVGIRILWENEILTALIQSCGANYNNVKDREPDTVVRYHLCVLSRVIISSPSGLGRIRFPSTFRVKQLVELYLRLLQDDDWIGPNVTLFSKLYLLSLLTILTWTDGRDGALNQVLEHSNAVLLAVERFLSREHMGNLLYSVVNGELGEEEEMPVSHASLQVRLDLSASRDVVNTTDVSDAFRKCLEHLGSLQTPA